MDANVTRRSAIQWAGAALSYQLATGAAAGVASRSQLAARPSEAAAALLLGEPGREGMFQFDRGDLSAKVSADTAQGIYVPPASEPSGASGAWVRKFDGPVNPLWFGIVKGLNGGANGRRNSAAWNALWATLQARGSDVGRNRKAVEPIRFPPGDYEFASTIDIRNGTTIIEGADGHQAGSFSTRLKFPAGITGIRIQAHNSSGASGKAGPDERSGQGTIIRNLAVEGGWKGGSEAEAHGIQLRATAAIDTVRVNAFEGDGVYGAADLGSSTEGNINHSSIRNVTVTNCRNGLYLDGADANIITIIGSDFSSNRQWGIWDSSFLGNSYFGCHVAGNGHPEGGAPSSVVSHGGYRYAVKAGQEAGASTSAPSGTATDNRGWYYMGAGGITAGFPAWSSGTAYRAGGAFRTDNNNARNIFVGCYSEPGEGPAQIVRPSQVIGGHQLAGVKGSGAYLRMSSTGGAFVADAFKVEPTSRFAAQLGELASPTALLFADDTAAPNSWRLRLKDNDLLFDYANNIGFGSFSITGPNTARQFGTGAPMPHAFYVPSLIVGDVAHNIGDARRIAFGTAAPTTGAHGQGEIVFNRSPASGRPMGWICSAAGTPGTWLPLAKVP